MNRPTTQAIWESIGKDNVTEFKKYVCDEHSYRFSTRRMWNQKSEDGIKSRTIFEICCINKSGVPEKGATAILKFIIDTFPHLVTVQEVIKCIKLSEINKRDSVKEILLEFMNTHFIDVRGFEDVTKKWILRETCKNMEPTVGYFVSFKADSVWMSYDAYVHKWQVCPATNAKLLPVVILSFEDSENKIKLPKFNKPTRLPSLHHYDAQYKDKEQTKDLKVVYVANKDKESSKPSPLPETI